MNFWDSSAVLPLILDEQASSVVQRILARDFGVAVWWATPVECVSGLARVLREGRIEESGFEALKTRLGELAAEADEIGPSQVLRETAQRVLRTHPLSAADALQLAAALVWAEHRPSRRGFVCLDQRLRQAAAIEGFRVLPESAALIINEEQP